MIDTGNMLKKSVELPLEEGIFQLKLKGPTKTQCWCVSVGSQEMLGISSAYNTIILNMVLYIVITAWRIS